MSGTLNTANRVHLMYGLSRTTFPVESIARYFESVDLMRVGV